MKHVPYFGYGNMADPRILGAVVGRKVEGDPGKIYGFQLCVQQLSDISPIPRKILAEAWGPAFRSYAIREMGDRSFRVPGMLFDLTEEEHQFVANWELTSEDWFKEVTTDIELDTGLCLDVVTQALTDGQRVSEVVDISKPIPLLGNMSDIVKLAKKLRARAA